MQSPHDVTCQIAWDLLAIQARHEDGLTDGYFAAYIDQVEARMKKAANRTRHAMNGALIAIGLRSEPLRALALAAAGRIGTVQVDHGETGEFTPDAATMLKRSKARKK